MIITIAALVVFINLLLLMTITKTAYIDSDSIPAIVIIKIKGLTDKFEVLKLN